MTGIRSTTGLASGLDIGSLVDALMKADRAPAARLESRIASLQATQAGLGTLQAQLLGISSAVAALNDRNTFSSLAIQNSDSAQVAVSTKASSVAGTYQFQAIQLATSHRVVSKGYSDANSALGVTGQVTVRRGSTLSRPVKLDLLNDGQGIRRGQIQITDRSGKSATVDLRNAVTSQDVLDAINNAAVGVTASVSGGQFILEDTTGQAGAFAVTEVGSGKTAKDLGLLQSVNTDTLSGETVLRVTDQFTLNLLNDGNGLRTIADANELRVNLASGTQVEVNLDGANTVHDVLAKLNTAGETGNTFTAALVDDRIVITDNTTGTGTLSVENLSGSNAVEVLGLNRAASGNTVTGGRLVAGLNSVLLKNLRGGQGITELGSVNLTDRIGATATIDLSAAETLDDVLGSINQSSLALRAELSANGTGIVIRDTSGSTTSNLIVADAGTGTLAADLGITFDGASNQTTTTALNIQNVNTATSLDRYTLAGNRVSSGSFKITDSAGNTAIVNITATSRTVGDVLDKINASGLAVTAKLNSTGDGIELIDNSGGTGTFAVSELGGRTAADLRLTTAATTGTDGKQRINAQQAIVVNVAATDSLTTIASRISAVGGTLRATVESTGAALNGFRLALQSTTTGDGGRFQVDDSGLNLGLDTADLGRDALLRIGGQDSAATILSSSNNTFSNAVGGLDVTALKVGTSPATVVASSDTQKIQTALQSFVTSYNAYIDKAADLTKFDTATQKRGVLQGSTTPLNLQLKFNALINKVNGSPTAAVKSLADVGVRLTAGGKLTFDSSKLTTALQNNPNEVRTMFSDTNTGFAKSFKTALDQLNDATTGTLTAELNGMGKTVTSLQTRVAQYDEQLAGRRQRLELKFVRMETIISGLQSQQGTLTSLTSVLANLRASTSS
ncbi:MAG TPA: flagellar filament capping protein FliD [Planctomycetaceae bacterium]|nr:flagellar filament capping protein FliD [Planctomycetaceae bacterium]